MTRSFSSVALCLAFASAAASAISSSCDEDPLHKVSYLFEEEDCIGESNNMHLLQKASKKKQPVATAPTMAEVQSALPVEVGEFAAPVKLPLKPNLKAEFAVTRQGLRHNALQSSCHEMTNYGSYFTASVQVGNPKQTFEIIADTGSNSLLIPDCQCLKLGLCGSLANCFNRTSSSSFRSETFLLDGVEMMHAVTLSYGSGDIRCFVTSDEVLLEQATAYMKDAVFLIENEKPLEGLSIEGILGLGLPGSSLGLGGDKELFMEVAGVFRYSLCFNAVNPGVLRMNVPPLEKPMGNIGQIHWGLDLQGMSVGNVSAGVLFCDPATKKKGMMTACGAIPDSGTTLMLGSEEQVHVLYGALCGQWPRCSRIAATYPGISRSKIFAELLATCMDWLDESSEGILEVPSITLHLAGSSGTPQQIELSPWSYVAKTLEPTFKIVHKQVFGVGEVEVLVPSGQNKYRCTPFFGTHDYVTTTNGPIWIFGSPLFYEHTVSFDLGSKPEAMSIKKEPCSLCGTSLVASSDTGLDQKHRRSMRRLHGGLRDSSIDRTRPL